MASSITSLPILYSFRRCPYAMRARLALKVAGMNVELREVELKNKPQALLDVSPKATIPVLQLADGTVIDESRDILHWALAQSNTWQAHKEASECWLQHTDENFKPWLDKYKYADRHPEHDPVFYRKQGELFLQKIETQLSEQGLSEEGACFLLGPHATQADLGVFPFIRQFAMVDLVWFESSPYPLVIGWFQYWMQSELFKQIMTRYKPWQPKDAPVIFS